MKEIREIIDAKWGGGYCVRVTFSDMSKALLDLEKYLGRGIFKELTKIEKFKQFRVDAELGTIVWPNGADIAPEVLYLEAFAVKGSKLGSYGSTERSRGLSLAKEPAKKYGKKK